MKSMLQRWTTMWVCTVLTVAGCGSDSAGSGSTGGSSGLDGSDNLSLPTNVITTQNHLSESSFTAQIPSELQDVVQGLQSSGFNTFQGAGTVEDSDGNTALWAVYADAAGAEGGAVLACLANGACTPLRTSRTTSGALSLQGVDGADASPPWSAAPALLRDLVGQDHSGRTSIATGALTADEIPTVNIARRRMVIANAFGPAQGVQLGAWRSLAAASGAFSSVELIDYASVFVLEDAIQHAAPADALIWVGAGVREKLGNEYKTIGMTANRGLYGDVTVRGVEEIRQWLDANPYGGPGLVVLVGEETHGDGGSQANKPAAIFSEFSDIETHRIVVAVQGRSDTASILEASQKFLSEYMTGSTLREALDAGNAIFESAGGTASLVTNREGTSEAVTFPGALDAFFSDAPPKDPVRANIYLNVANVCIRQGTGDGYSEDEGQVNFFVDVTFDGPFFQGSREWEVEGEALQADVQGVMLGREPGDGVFLTFFGDVKPSVKGLTIWGSGAIEDRSDIDNPNRIFFDGKVLATEYTNGNGDTCQLKSPTLSGSTSEQLSWIDFDLPK
ncbi:MAG: hypothetical protein VX223_17475 [Myxococcota bacterium]|nr:hypothetical protein [Myxococcota bacterium]